MLHVNVSFQETQSNGNTPHRTIQSGDLFASNKKYYALIGNGL